MTSIEREREDINGDQLCPMKGILVRPAATPWVPSSGRRGDAIGWTADVVAPNISAMVRCNGGQRSEWPQLLRSA